MPKSLGIFEINFIRSSQVSLSDVVLSCLRSPSLPLPSSLSLVARSSLSHYAAARVRLLASPLDGRASRK
jgi:hypothetical protein